MHLGCREPAGIKAVGKFSRRLDKGTAYGDDGITVLIGNCGSHLVELLGNQVIANEAESRDLLHGEGEHTFHEIP
jgi:hypothetical protein